MVKEKKLILETERLYVKTWSLENLDALYDLMSDPKVHIYTDGSNWTKEKTRSYLTFNMNRESLTFDNFHGAIFLKSSNQLIGFTGLNPFELHAPEIEWQIGYQYWNKGYATEVGKAVIQHAFNHSSINKVYGMADPNNIASNTVMQKIGMISLGIRKFRDDQVMFYEISRVLLKAH